VDASRSATEIDARYYFIGQHPSYQVAIANHKARSTHEIDLLAGDLIRYDAFDAVRYDGFMSGNNTSTGQSGLYPACIAVDKPEVADFPHKYDD